MGINEVVMYRTSDGRLFENLEEAEKEEKKVVFEDKVREFADRHGEFADRHGYTYGGKEMLCTVIKNNADELRSILMEGLGC